MTILYVTSVWNGINNPSMHTDFVIEMVGRGHKVIVLALSEKRNNEPTHVYTDGGAKILVVSCGNIQKTNKYEKVISSLLANSKMFRAAKRYLKNENVDVVVWSVSTTLIYFGVKRITKLFKAKQYLLLKEYWPQDPVDLGAMKNKGLVFNFFKSVESRMLSFADMIGTSSPAGINYVTSRYPIESKKCEVCPHCEQNRDNHFDKSAVFKKYGLEEGKFTFVYGGNFGLSQGPHDIISCIKGCETINGIQFVFLGSGTEYTFVRDSLINQGNVVFLSSLDYNAFFELASCCDCGLIFLYKGYNVPNIPGKFNTYLNCGIPVLACVDKTTDLGTIISTNNIGLSVFSGDIIEFRNAVLKMIDSASSFKPNCKRVLISNYLPSIVAERVESFFKFGGSVK